MAPSSDLDTLGIFKELKSAGIEEEVAEALARIIKDAISEASASKTDLDILKTRLESRIVESLAEMRVEAANSRSDLHKLEKMVGEGENRIVSMVVVAVSAIVSMLMFFWQFS